MTAVVIQHELDHLDGIVFTDKVSPIKLDQAKRKIKNNLKKITRARIVDPEIEKEVKNIAKNQPAAQVIDS